MNDKRRKEITEIIGSLRASHSKLVNVMMDEEYAIDCIPENLQESDRYMDMEDGLDRLEEASDMIDDAIDKIYSVI